jgi:hypothetical protein
MGAMSSMSINAPGKGKGKGKADPSFYPNLTLTLTLTLAPTLTLTLTCLSGALLIFLVVCMTFLHSFKLKWIFYIHKSCVF